MSRSLFWSVHGLALSFVLCLSLVFPPCVLGDCLCGPACSCGPDCVCGSLPRPNLPPVGRWKNEPTLRKNQNALTSEERREFIEAVKTLKKTIRPGGVISVYDEYVQAHIEAMMNEAAHEGPALLPWHRAFIRAFELDLQAVNPGVALPYWDFTLDNSPQSAMWAGDFMGGNGDPDDNYAVANGPFQKGRWLLRFHGPHLRRDFGNRRAPTLPRAEQVLAAFLIDQYDDDPWSPDSDITRSFRNYLEGWHHPSGEPEMHNRVHAWIGGSMLLMSSPNEPAFFPLHANLDRIWGQWQGIYGLVYEPIKGARPGHNLRDEMQPFGVTPEDVLDYRALGYRYDTDP